MRGWKRIAQHLGVTQSTAIRWSKSPDFPLIKMENGGSVYADAAQLDAWLSTRQRVAIVDTNDVADVQDDASPLIGPRQRRWRNPLLWAGALGLAIAMPALGGQWFKSGDVDGATQSSGNATLDQKYRMARSAWASRTPEGVVSSVKMFGEIVAEDPSFVPGLTGLADARILSCEFSDADRSVAFHEAENAVKAALSLSPEDGDANRIKGFLVYWQTREMSAARPYFDNAITVDPGDYLGYLWYGNALVDAGSVGQGKHMLDKALLLSPESTAVAADYAYTLWQHGDSDQAFEALTQLQHRNPENPVPYGFSALFHLAQGDVAQYLEMSEHWATIIGDDRQSARVANERQAFATGGKVAVLRHISRSLPIGDNPYWHGGNLPAAIAASHLGDRRLLASILNRRDKDYDVAKEDWRPLRFPLEPFLRWRNDPVLAPLILRQFHISRFPEMVDTRRR